MKGERSEVVEVIKPGKGKMDDAGYSELLLSISLTLILTCVCNYLIVSYPKRKIGCAS